MEYIHRLKNWLRKLENEDTMVVRRMYCMREKFVTEHEYKTEEIDGLEFYREFTCLNCGLTMGYGKKSEIEKGLGDDK